MDPTQRLWHDRSIFQERAARQAAALQALVRSLTARRPLAGGEAEFLTLHRFVAQLPPGPRTRVLADPYARLWLRLSFALCGAVLRGEPVPELAAALARELESDDPRTLLGAQLDQWKRLALGAALLAGTKLDFQTPLEVTLPMAIPGAGASLVGDPSLRILGVADGAVRTEGGEARVATCPTAGADGFRVPLQPHAYTVPGLGWMPPAGRTTLAYQASQVPLVEAGLALVARHTPEAFAQIRALVRWLAVNPPEDDEDLNFVSYSELPGGFSFRGIPHGHVAAEMFIHESHHNRLFCLEELEPILAGQGLGTDQGALYYSPWREQLRPLRGLFHAVYVNTPQARFWLEVLRSRDGDEATLEYAEDLLIRYPLMLELGVLQLERHARFTEGGRAHFRQLLADVEALRSEIASLGLPGDRTALRVVSATGEVCPSLLADGCRSPTSRDVVAEHIRLYDSEWQIPAGWIETQLSPWTSRARTRATAARA